MVGGEEIRASRAVDEADVGAVACQQNAVGADVEAGAYVASIVEDTTQQDIHTTES